MNPLKRGKSRYSACGCLVVVGAVAMVPLSILTSLGLGILAADAGAAMDRPASSSISTLWGVALWAIVLSTLWAWGAIWEGDWIGRAHRGLKARASRRSKVLRSAVALAALSALILLPASWAANAVGAGAPATTAIREAFLALSPICRDQSPIPGAAVYGGSVHGMEIVATPADSDSEMADEQSDVSTRAEGLGPLPSTISSVQLVACIEPRTEAVVETCDYSPEGTDTRYRYSREVSVYVAATGEILDRRSFTGSSPADCPEVMSVSHSEEHGGDVGWDDQAIWDYLLTWASGPLQTPGS